MERMNLKINLKNLDKKNLFKGKDGNIYLDATIVLNDVDDQYGNRGFVAQDFLKENKKDIEGNYVKTPIIGNVKVWDNKPAVDEPVEVEESKDDLPF